MKIFGISSRLIPIGIHFFVMYAGMCPMAIFGSTIAKQFGFSASTIGLIFFFVPLSSVIGRVILGMVADKYHLLKTIKMIGLAGCAGATLLIALLPKRGVAWVPAVVRCSLTETIVESRHFDEILCQSTADAHTDECQILCNNNETEFQNMCSDWQNTLKNDTSFNCDKIFAELQFESFTITNHTCSSAKMKKVKDGKSEILLPHCPLDRNSSCSILCAKENTSVGTDLLLPFFWLFFVLYITFGIGYSVAVTFTDTICFQLIGEKTHLYGRLRVPGSLGWGLGGFFTGILIDHFSDHNANEKNYLPMFIFVITAFLIDVLWSSKLKVGKSTSETFDLKKVVQLFSHFDVKVFAIWTFFAGFFQQIVWQYSYWLLDDISRGDEKDYLKTLQGFLAFTNTMTGDVISFSTSGWLFKKFGYKNCMTAAFCLNAIQFFFYSILSRPIWSIPISSLNGITYGLQYALITSYCNSLAAPGTEATVQATFNCIFDGIGTSLGGLCGGFFYSWYGGSHTFRINCFISIAGLLLHVIIRYAAILRIKKEADSKS